MFRLLAGVLALALLAPAAVADEKTDAKPAPSGTWVREASGLDVTLAFAGKDTLTVTVIGGANGAVVTCRYTAAGGVVRAKVTKVEEKGNFPAKPPVGLEFRFTWSVKGDAATLDDLRGEQVDEAKPVLEGEYDRKKEKK